MYMKMLRKIDQWMKGRERISLPNFLSSIFSAKALWSAPARRNFGSATSTAKCSLVQVIRCFFYGLLLIGRDRLLRSVVDSKNSDRIQSPDASGHSRGRWLQIGQVMWVLTFLLQGLALGSPFGEAVRYPSFPGTLLGIVQLDGRPVEAGAVLGFYQGTELRGRFEVSSNQIVGGASYFNAVIQQSGQSETLTKAILWIPESEMLFERPLNISMPLSDDFGKFDSIQTFSFTQVLFDEAIIQTLSSRVLDGFQTQEEQKLVLDLSQILDAADRSRVKPNALYSQSGSALSLDVESGLLTYQPRLDFNGPEILFLPLVGSQTHPLTYLKIQVDPVNDPPVIQSRTYHLREDVGIIFTLNANDPEGEALTYTYVDLPVHGTVSGIAPTVQYQPDAGYSGIDSLRVKVSDGVHESATALISFDVGAVNDAPSAFAQSLQVAEDGSLEIVLSGNDPDNDPLSYHVTQAPDNGMITSLGSLITYRPNTDFSGEDRLRFVVSDGSLESSETQITITVSPVNDPPVLIQRVFTLSEDGEIDLALVASDPDQDPLLFEIVTQPQHGTLAGTAPQLTYRPHEGFFGNDSFDVRVSDGVAVSDVTAMQLVIEPVNDAPLAQPATTQVPYHDKVVLPDLGTDADGDELTLDLISNPQHGQLSMVDGQWVYQHTGTTLIEDRFTYRVTDGELFSNSALVTLDIVKASFEITMDVDRIGENGGQVTVTFTRQSHLDQPLEFGITSMQPDRLVFPATVTIPAGERSHSFIVGANDNLFFEGDVEVGLDVVSSELNDQRFLITVLEDDQPSLTLTPLFPRISEKEGETEVSLFFNRPPDGEALEILLNSPNAVDLEFPAQVELSAGASKVNFAVKAIDNGMRDGDRQITLNAVLSPSVRAETLLTVLDDEVSNVGRLSDGWIAGATVFFDRNRNRVLDAGEPSTVTDETGRFWLDLPVAVYDANGDNKVDAKDGLLVGKGGVDITTGIPQASTLLSSPAASVISPLTTLVVLVVENNPVMDETQAATQVQSALKIPPGVDIMRVDAFEAVAKGDATAVSALQAAAKVQDTTVQVGSLIGSSSQTSAETHIETARQSLAQRIGQGESPELESGPWVEAFIDSTARSSGVELSQEIVSSASAIVSQGNRQKDEIAGSGLSVKEAAQELVRHQAFSQDRVTADLDSLATGLADPEALRLQYSPENYSKLIQGIGTGTLTELDTRAGTFEFGTPKIEIQENGRHDGDLIIRRSLGSYGKVKLRIELQGVTAKAGEDFVSAPLETVFESFQINQVIALEEILIDDEQTETVESLSVKLTVLESERDGALIGGQGTASVSILDDDGVGRFQFSASNISVSEADSDVSGVFVERLEGSIGDVTILLEYLELDSNAELGTDFQWTSQELVFASGVTKRPIPLRIIQDDSLEADEVLFIRMRLHPEFSLGAVLGDPSTLQLQLLNDDLGEAPVIEAPAQVSFGEDSTLGPEKIVVTDQDTHLDSVTLRIESDSPLFPAESVQLIQLDEPGQWDLWANPVPNGAGNATLTLYASDGYQTTTETILIEVRPENDHPVIEGLPNRLEVGRGGRVIQFKISDIETESDSLTVLISAQQQARGLEEYFVIERNGPQFQLRISASEDTQGEVLLHLIVLDSDGGFVEHTTNVVFLDSGVSRSPIQFERLPSNQLRLTWEGDLRLHATPDLLQPFQLIQDAISPFDVPIEQIQFYILRPDIASP